MLHTGEPLSPCLLPQITRLFQTLPTIKRHTDFYHEFETSDMIEPAAPPYHCPIGFPAHHQRSTGNTRGARPLYFTSAKPSGSVAHYRVNLSNCFDMLDLFEIFKTYQSNKYFFAFAGYSRCCREEIGQFCLNVPSISN